MLAITNSLARELVIRWPIACGEKEWVKPRTASINSNCTMPSGSVEQQNPLNSADFRDYADRLTITRVSLGLILVGGVKAGQVDSTPLLFLH